MPLEARSHSMLSPSEDQRRWPYWRGLWDIILNGFDIAFNMIGRSSSSSSEVQRPLSMLARACTTVSAWDACTYTRSKPILDSIKSFFTHSSQVFLHLSLSSLTSKFQLLVHCVALLLVRFCYPLCRRTLRSSISSSRFNCHSTQHLSTSGFRHLTDEFQVINHQCRG